MNFTSWSAMRTLRSWIFPTAVAATIYGLSSLSGNQLAVLLGPAYSLHHIDKIGHTIIYAVFGWGLIRALAFNPYRPAVGRVLVTLLIGVAYGAMDEWHQSFVPGRACDPFDWVADAAGCSIAIATWSWVSLGDRLLSHLMILRIRRHVRRPRIDYRPVTCWQRLRIQLGIGLQKLLILETRLGELFEFRLRKTLCGHRLYRPAHALALKSRLQIAVCYAQT